MSSGFDGPNDDDLIAAAEQALDQAEAVAIDVAGLESISWVIDTGIAGMDRAADELGELLELGSWDADARRALQAATRQLVEAVAGLRRAMAPPTAEDTRAVERDAALLVQAGRKHIEGGLDDLQQHLARAERRDR